MIQQLHYFTKYPTEMCAYTSQDTYRRMFKAVLLLIFKNWKQYRKLSSTQFHLQEINIIIQLTRWCLVVYLSMDRL